MSNSKTPINLKADTNRLLELVQAMGPSSKEAIEQIKQRYSKEIKSLSQDEQSNVSKLLSTVNSHTDSGRYGYALLYLFDMGHSLGTRLSAHSENQQKEIAKARKQLPLDERNRCKALIKEQVLETASELLKIDANEDLDHFQLAELARNQFKRIVSEAEETDANDDGLLEEIRAGIPEVKFYENGTKKYDVIANWIKKSDLKVKKPSRGRPKFTK